MTIFVILHLYEVCIFSFCLFPCPGCSNYTQKLEFPCSGISALCFITVVTPLPISQVSKYGQGRKRQGVGTGSFIQKMR